MNTTKIKQILKVGFLPAFLFFTLLSATAQNVDPNLQKLATAMQIIRYAYVDTINEPKLVENAIIETLKELDPHSYYISKEDIDAVNEPLVGSFEGIGVSFQIFKDTVLVIAPIVGGPSEKVGIMAGDKIVKMGGDKSYGDHVDNQFVFDHLRGPKGSKVEVSVYRKGRSELLDFTITRDKIPMNSIDATFMVDDKIGYIKLSRFAQTSTVEFRESLAKLKALGMEKLIFDLRGNSGGMMQAAIEISDEMLKDGKLIVFTEGINSPKQKFNSTSRGNFENEDVVIMIDEGSASSSEIVAGAIQDWDRGLIMGRRSYGKGLVQRPFRLPDGSVIRLTTARYYTPTGRSIQRPYDTGLKDYYSDIYNRLKNGEFVHADSIHFPDSLKFLTPGKRVVYGGGGIMPDVFIPWDSTIYSDYYTDLIRKGVLNEYTLNYVDDHRSELSSKYKSMEDFAKNFNVNSKLFADFVKFGESKDVKMSEEGLKTSKELITHVIKGLIGRNLWDMDAYFKVMMEIDDGFLKAVEKLKTHDAFAQLGVNQ
jgi:carboxyl-terminal processing protease